MHGVDTRVTCDLCGGKFANKRNVQIHLAAVHCLLPRPHVCPYCSKQFVMKRSYWRHIAHHENSKPFACPVCGKAFARKQVTLNIVTLNSITYWTKLVVYV